MYDTLELDEVKQIPCLRVSFFPDFPMGWHKNRILDPFCVFGHPETCLGHNPKNSLTHC